MEYVGDLSVDSERFAVAVQHKVLTSTRIGAATAVSMKVRPDFDVTKRAADHLLLKLEAYVQTDHLVSQTKTVDFDESVTFERPATWWDHFKSEQVEADSPLWRWVARRWPPRTITETRRLTQRVDVTFEAKHLYPQSNWIPKDFGEPILVESYRVDKG